MNVFEKQEYGSEGSPTSVCVMVEGGELKLDRRLLVLSEGSSTLASVGTVVFPVPPPWFGIELPDGEL